ncbi:MAG: hypothetical protein R3Y06_02635 [Faecalibacterium sp.]
MRDNSALQKIKWILLALALGVGLCASAQSKASAGYMVRAVLIEQEGTVYQVGVLYQDPEAAANSADALAPFKLAQGQGESLSAAFQSLEQNFTQTLSYQLSDYLLLSGQCSKATVEEYAQQVQLTQQGRYAAEVYFLSQEIADLAQTMAQNPEVAQALLEALEEYNQSGARLYEVSQETLIMPCVSMQEDGSVAPIQTMYLLSAQEGGYYDEIQTQLYQLLSNTQSEVNFLMGDVAVTIGSRVRSKGEPLAGVSDTPAVAFSFVLGDTSAEGESGVAQAGALPTLCVYALVEESADVSQVARSNMEAYVTYLANAEPALLAQLGVGRVEMHLYSLANLW